MGLASRGLSELFTLNSNTQILPICANSSKTVATWLMYATFDYILRTYSMTCRRK